jgi:predicted lysophospholipase L1 biosynthesis ABC-type transport system permease subunit
MKLRIALLAVVVGGAAVVLAWRAPCARRRIVIESQ